jgi:hypothetical protein
LPYQKVAFYQQLHTSKVPGVKSIQCAREITGNIDLNEKKHRSRFFFSPAIAETEGFLPT